MFMSRTWQWWVVVGAMGLMACRTTGTVVREEPNPPRQVLQFEPVEVTADLSLAKLNDEELFASGTAAFAANDFKQAARYFGRIVDFHPDSSHRREALYNAGLAHQKLEQWEEAYQRFSELADAAKGTGDALEAAFRVAESYYHQQRYEDATQVLRVIADREDLPMGRRIEARVQQGVCELDAGHREQAETTLRKAITDYKALPDKDEVEEHLPAQAYFYIGEMYRQDFDAVKLDPAKGSDKLAKDLNFKAELLLSAQGNYLLAIRVGNGDWATAAGAQIGLLYESLYDQMVNTQAPAELNAEEAQVYRHELRKKIRVLLTKSIDIYERTLEAAERTGSQNTFVDRTRESLRKVRDLLLADADTDAESAPPPTPASKPRS